MRVPKSNVQSPTRMDIKPTGSHGGSPRGSPKRKLIIHLDKRLVGIPDINANINPYYTRYSRKPRLNTGIPRKRLSVPALLDLKKKDAENQIGPW